MIADILLKKAVSVVSANHRVRKMDIFDYGLKLSFLVLGDLTTEDRGDLVGLADRAVGIQQSLARLIQCSAPVKEFFRRASTAPNGARAGYQGRRTWLL